MSQIKHGLCAECGKNYEDIKKTCGHCGYSGHGTFMTQETLPYWKCGNCSRIEQRATPPEKCPGCGEVCDFKNVTSYDPEHGGPGNIDPQL
ncbi:MAG: hypothetical protein PF442_12325 [Desulfobulbaceae bacterium]|jgi:DNA-directed RNA polymerase subunit RPC12/RpoP|nr:hypothetical protein [Desulfobulbaceae bacterium]